MEAKDQTTLVRNWILAGIICGILADVVYAVSVAVEMPLRVQYPIFWFFGPLLVVAAVGLYHFLAQHRKTLAGQLGALYLIIAGSLVTLVGTMQGVARYSLGRVEPEGTDEAAMEIWRLASRAANTSQAGADLAWDMFIFSAMIFLGFAMLRNPYFGRVIGFAGILVGLMGLAFNLYTWPANPGTAGLVDAGPFAGLWFLVVAIQQVRRFKSLGLN